MSRRDAGSQERSLSPFMKITTKIISGYGLFIAILAGLAICQAIVINRVQSINQTLKEISFQKTATSLNALENLKSIADLTKKFLNDPDTYRKKLADYRNAFENNLKELQLKAAGGEEQDSAKRLAQGWETFAANLEIMQTGSKRDDAAANLLDELERLEMQSQAVYESNLRAMSEKVYAAEKTGKISALILFSTTLFALAVGVLVSFLIYRSIAKPLVSLTEGTKALAEGKIFYNLDSTRKDEFSQIAKDFNTLTRRLKELDKPKNDSELP
jgi:nitrate/nitrite-specific signal transduction histidine kinase